MRKHVTLTTISAIVGSLLVPVQSSGTEMGQLPPELQQMIFNKLETKDLVHFGQVNKDMNAVVKEALTTYKANIAAPSLKSEHIKALLQIGGLRLRANGATDQSMELIGQLTNLIYLDLRGAKLTDAGFAQLKNLTNLGILILADTNINDSGVANIAGLQRLKVLALGPEVTDAGLAHLKNLTNLRVLFLDQTKISNAGLANLAGLQNLEALFLGGTDVLRPGLENLIGLKNLKYVNLYKIRATPADKKSIVTLFKEKIPNTKVDFNYAQQPEEFIRPHF